ncbi:hypothetical protein [Deinococcus altitudinis]|uniref:COG4705 family protein n=1 Tax=Deinococcus altitudinis TaxID=468914 RepID=UPI0038925500
MTALFWIIKVLTTGMGEAASDFLAHTLGPVPAVGLSGIGLIVALLLQFRSRRYLAGIYWTAVVMVSVFGTLAADAAHVGFSVPYWASTICFFVALGVIFLLWQRREGTLSVHSISTRRREMFYWATVLCTFALGTAAGDLTAVGLGLGWLASGLLFTGLIAVPAVLSRFGLNSVLAFWWAYVLTRPLGASFADWMALPHSRGGLGAGTGMVTLAMSGIIILLVGFLALAQRKTASAAAATAGRGRTA